MKYVLGVFLSLSLIFLSMFGVSVIYGTIFPLKYEEEIAYASECYGVDPIYIASVINCESGFNKNAESNKGAKGLMQLMPSTAKYLAEKLNYGDYDLNDIDDNINLGTYYLSILKDKFKDDDLMLCAYNAGPTNVLNWLNNKEYSKDGKTLQKIPFKETENYLKKCHKAINYYNHKREYFNI